MRALRQAFFDRYIEQHPEEATTLGIQAGADRLRDHSPQGLSAERRWYAEVQAELRATNPQTLEPDDRLDHLCMTRLVEFECYAGEWLYSSIDWSVYPFHMLEIQRLHAETEPERHAMARRAAEIPRYLEQQQARVDSAIAERARVPDETLREFFVTHQIPAAINTLRTLGHEAAASAYEAHLRWMQQLETTDARAIGEEDLRARLRIMLGIHEEPEILIARARADLTEIQAQLVEVAAAVAPARQIRRFEDARALALELQQLTLDTDDVVGVYRRYVERATKYVADYDLLSLPDDYVMGIDILPESFAAAAGAANWPAPLKARGKLGHFLLAADPAAHPPAWAADLAVHEGLPGHHLQSFIWQRDFCDHPAPVRFLVVHDQVAIPRGYWAPMLNIEGWAVYAEELMRKAGFFTEQEALFVLAAHAVRAARVVGDLSLHAGLMSAQEVQQLLMREACLTERHAGLEVRRYAQIPLQASTYHLGRRAIEELASSWQDLREFHRHFLSFGPVDPRAIAPAG